MANTLDREASDQLWERYAVPAASGVLFDVAPRLSRNSPATVNFRNDERAPMLFIAFGEDHVVPPKPIKHNVEKYAGSKALTEYREFPGRCTSPARPGGRRSRTPRSPGRSKTRHRGAPPPSRPERRTMTTNGNTPDTIVLIHGFWVTPRSWEDWITYYEGKGYRVLAPAYPGFEVEVEALNADPTPIEQVTVPQIVERPSR